MPAILLKINNFFQEIGSVYVTPSNNSAELKIFKSSNFYILINHFKDYPLQGFKLYNYTIWRDLVELLDLKVLTYKDLNEINSLRDKLNKWN